AAALVGAAAFAVLSDQAFRYGTGLPCSSTKMSRMANRLGSGGVTRLAWLVTRIRSSLSSKAMLAGFAKGIGFGEPPGFFAGPEKRTTSWPLGRRTEIWLVPASAT